MTQCLFLAFPPGLSWWCPGDRVWYWALNPGQLNRRQTLPQNLTGPTRLYFRVGDMLL